MTIVMNDRDGADPSQRGSFATVTVRSVGPPQADELPPTRRGLQRHDRRSPVRRLRRSWVVLTTATAWLGYSLVGLWLVYGRDFMINDAVSRTVSAKLMVLSRDPHLGAVGFYWMPLPTVTRIPFVLVLDPLGASIMAGPFVSALFAAATIPVLVAIGRQLRLPDRITVTVAAVHALNPVVVFGAANGMSETTFGFFAALSVLLFLRWRTDRDTRTLFLFGLAVAGCLACRFETLVLLPVLLVGVSAQIDGPMRRAAVVLAALPSLMLFLIWTFASAVVVGDGLFWYTASRSTTATPDGAQWLPEDLGPLSAVGHVLRLTLVLAPALLPAGVAAFAVRRGRRTSAMLLGLAIVLPLVVTWQLADGSTWMVPRFLGHLPLFAAFAVLWTASLTHVRGRSAGSDGVAEVGGRFRWQVAEVLALVAVAVLAIGTISSLLYLADSDRAHAEGEYVLMTTILGRDDPRTLPGHDGTNEVFITDLEAFRLLTDELEERLDATDGRVVMDSLQAVPVVLTSQPERFIVPEDRDFEEILSDPVGRFDHIVVLDGRAETEFSVLIAEELERTEDGSWREVSRIAGAGRIFEFVDPSPAA